jgi:serine/threonine protein phosphatase 1
MRTIYAIGDIHGRADLLAGLLSEIKADAAGKERPLIVFLGDYVDRGPDSKGVIDAILGGIPGFDVVCLRGNHEDLMLGALEGTSDWHADCWALNGATETLRSYGGRENIPADHISFLRSLKNYHHEPPYLFVHAGVRPGLPLAEQEEQDLLWIRRQFLESRDDHGFIVVHGHTPMDEPEVKPNRINVDTGAVWSGRLTCVVLDGRSAPRFLQVGARDQVLS